MTKEKCPLNNFNACIGSECVFFIEPIPTKGAVLDNDLIIDPRDISFPCAITISGRVAFLANQPKPKEVNK